MEICTPEQFSVSGELTDDGNKKLADYLVGFHAPNIDDDAVKCVKCGSHIFGGGIMDALLSTFTWGLVHGEGFCTECNWPIRMYHSVDLDREEKSSFQFPLAHRCYTDDSHETEVDPALGHQDSEK